MSSPADQTAYWNSVADSKTFSHPFDAARFAAVVAPGARVLDFGCGYARTTAEIAAHVRRAVGVDPAQRMLDRGRAAHRDVALVRAAPGTAPFRDAVFDAVVLFALLTCVPDDDAQRALVAEARRVVRPGGIAYVSDLLVNDDARNRARYDAGRASGAPYGVFRLPEGAVLRHHDPAWIRALFADWATIEFREFVVTTMNGHASRAFQLLARRSA